MIEKIQFITQDLHYISHAKQAEEACSNGIKWVQLRTKNSSPEQWKKIALETQAICFKHNAAFIINDNVALAVEIDADGVHLGKTDLSPIEARKLLGKDKIIGSTANSWNDVVKLSKMSVDYIGLGPFQYTTTKQNLEPLLGIEGYTEIFEKMQHKKISIPIIAVGGIKTEHIKKLMNIGIHGIAISSLINHSKSKSTIIKEILSLV